MDGVQDGLLVVLDDAHGHLLVLLLLRVDVVAVHEGLVLEVHTEGLLQVVRHSNTECHNSWDRIHGETGSSLG